jgi:hypothetical protein
VTGQIAAVRGVGAKWAASGRPLAPKWAPTFCAHFPNTTVGNEFKCGFLDHYSHHHSRPLQSTGPLRSPLQSATKGVRLFSAFRAPFQRLLSLSRAFSAPFALEPQRPVRYSQRPVDTSVTTTVTSQTQQSDLQSEVPHQSNPTSRPHKSPKIRESWRLHLSGCSGTLFRDRDRDTVPVCPGTVPVQSAAKGARLLSLSRAFSAPFALEPQSTVRYSQRSVDTSVTTTVTSQTQQSALKLNPQYR